MKLRPVGADFSTRKDGQTDMTKLIVAFRNFANAPKKPCLSVPSHKDPKMYILLMTTTLWRRNESPIDDGDDDVCPQFSTCSYTGDILWSVITSSEVPIDSLLLSLQNGYSLAVPQLPPQGRNPKITFPISGNPHLWKSLQAIKSCWRWDCSVTIRNEQRHNRDKCDKYNLE
jgi:hypothetical protein